MALFQLDPPSIAARARAAAGPVRVPTLGASIVRGGLGFTATSIVGCAPWPILDRWFPWAGEVGLYITCTALFVGASGMFLHRLIIGPDSLSRFYKLFTPAFIAYALAWIACWVWLRDERGIYGGLFAGAVAMGAIFAWAFDAWKSALAAIAAIFVLNAIGFRVASEVEGNLILNYRLLAIFLWAMAYGVGFGAGIGAAFWLCQRDARALLKESAAR